VAAAIGPIALLFSHREEVAGWTVDQVTLVMGLYFLMQALIAGLVEPNLGEIVEAIRSGNLDGMLLKPADAQLLASVRRVAPGHLWDLLFAGALMGWSFAHLPAPRIVDLAVAALLLLLGAAAMYGVWLMAICTSFWFVRVDNLRFLLWSATDFGRWPLDIFARWVRFLLLVVVPVGLLTTFPVQALSGGWTGWMVALAAGVAVAFVAGSRALWNRAIRSYTSASS
jgi:ABC-2 type transport system permease protein